MQGRIPVIEALLNSLTTREEGAALPADVDPAEVAFVRSLVIDMRSAEEPDERERGVAATHLLAVYRPGDDWAALLDRLQPFQVAELRDMLAAMPPLPARLFLERYASPTR